MHPPSDTTTPRRRRGRGIRPWLIQLKLLGLVGFLGGLAALTSLTLLAPPPHSLEGWQTIRQAMRSIFFPCVFGGLLVAITAGISLFLQHPRHFIRTRWFRLKVSLLAVLIPALHLWARGRVEAFHAAVEEARLNEAAERFEGVGVAYAVALVSMLAVAWIGRYKPRLGERYGRRSVKKLQDGRE